MLRRVWTSRGVAHDLKPYVIYTCGRHKPLKFPPKQDDGGGIYGFPTAQRTDPRDRAALLSIYSSTSGAYWNQGNWHLTRDPCFYSSGGGGGSPIWYVQREN